MKPYLVLPVTTVVSVALFAYMRSAETDRERQNRLMRFQDIKLRVTYDVLTEYEKEASEGQAPIDQANEKQKSLEMAVNDLRNQNEKAKQESEDCLQFKKSSNDVLVSAQAEYNNTKDLFNKEMSDWNQEIEKLKQQLSAKSPVCEFLPSPLKVESVASKLCGIEVVKEQEKKEEPKKEEPKAEAPKAEAPKAEAPKAEEKAPKEEEKKEEEAPKAKEP
ncbi:FK506-binding protein 4 [Cynoglossus semilaevis]|uniref:Zgc:174935 n=1 Tax=Cynoglossus semilaevis TaxID=244447 RepID=A0A3P8UQ61_CYNSE|nr:FK506-binding protein 4-like [Cynoglossus semilaevis]XP_008321281.1 FK506-binding protein 4-like [Cynoglossus semilaevis]